MHSKTTTCQECCESFLFQPAMFNGRNVFIPRFCDPCMERLLDEEARNRKRTAVDGAVSFLKKTVPPIYWSTDKNRLPFNSVVTMDSWEYNPRGIGMVGESGAGKSRLAVVLLKRMAQEEGRYCIFAPATEFANACADQFSDDKYVALRASVKLSEVRNTPILLLDDLGKNRMTDRSESSLYELLEYRTSRMLPTHWTSNSNAKQLRTMFSSDRADAIMRRLIEFSDIYTF